MRRRYDRIFKDTVRKAADKRMLPLWLCVFGLIAVFVLVTSLGKSSKNIGPQDTEFYSKSKITVGMAVGIDGMAEISSSGEITGLNRDVMDMLMHELFPEKTVEYVVIESQQASYALKTGQIDLAIGALTSGVTKTQGLSISVPYCNETVYAYVKPSSGITTLSGLIGKRVYATTTEFTKKSLNSAFKEKGLDITALTAASYPDLIYNMDNGRADGVIAMRGLAREIGQKYTRIEEPVMTVGCRIIAWKDNPKIITVINACLEKHRQDGSLAQMREKWGFAEQGE